MNDKEFKISPIKYYLQPICDKNNTDLKNIINNTPYKYENILRKLKENTIRYQELKDILNVLGYDLIIIDKTNKPFSLF